MCVCRSADSFDSEVIEEIILEVSHHLDESLESRSAVPSGLSSRFAASLGMSSAGRLGESGWNTNDFQLQCVTICCSVL